MLQASSLFRLLGDDARLRILRLLAAERLNVSELTGHPRDRAVRRVPAPRAAQGCRADRRAARRRLHLLPARAVAPGGRERIRDRWPRSCRPSSPHAARTETGRADDARLAEVRRLRKENFDTHAGPDTNERQLVPGPELGGVVAGARPPPARAARGRHRVRRGLSDRRGEPLGVARHRRGSLAASS